MFQSQLNCHISSCSKKFVPAGPKCNVLREGCDKNVTSSEKIFSCARASGSFQAGIGKPATQNPGPGQVLKLCFVPSRTQKNDVMMWRNRHICAKFQENRHIFGSTKKKKSKPGSVTSNLECDEMCTGVVDEMDHKIIPDFNLPSTINRNSL